MAPADKEFERKMTGKVGDGFNDRQRTLYEKSKEEGKLVEDIENISWDELYSTTSPNEGGAPNPFGSDIGLRNKYANYTTGPIIQENGWKVYEHKDDEDLFVANKGDKFIKIKSYQCLDIHKIGNYIAFPGWDDITYFNTETGKKKTISIR